MKQIYDLLKNFFRRKHFVYVFEYYNGTEDDNNFVIGDQNVYEYEFINQGASIVLINGTLKLYPQFAGIPPYRVKLPIRANEKDVQRYKYEFIPLDYQVCNEITMGASAGTFASAITGTIQGGIDGNITGDLTGTIVGDVTGTIAGTITGDLAGTIVGDIQGTIIGTILGTITGTIGVADGVVDEDVDLAVSEAVALTVDEAVTLVADLDIAETVTLAVDEAVTLVADLLINMFANLVVDEAQNGVIEMDGGAGESCPRIVPAKTYETEKACTGAIFILNFFDGDEDCDYDVTLYLDGIAIAGPITINSANTIPEIQALIDASIIPPFDGTIVVSQQFQSVFFTVTDVLPLASAGILSMTIGTSGVGCAGYIAIPVPMTCTVVPIPLWNSLLVIEKIVAPK